MSQSATASAAPAYEPDEIIFSLQDGQVWASWLDGRPSVMLGDHASVMAMMSYYIKHSEVAERLLSSQLEAVVSAPGSKPRAAVQLAG